MGDFSVVGSRYIHCDGKHVCTVIKDEGAYVPPLLRKLNSYEERIYALTVLDKMIGRMGSVLREPEDTDKRVIESLLIPRSSLLAESKHGVKHTCVKCGQKFYDLNGRVKACPAANCKEPL